MVTVSARMTAPSDLYGHDQPRTVAYSVDMAQNGREALPTDTMGYPATKPPMTNWLAQPTVQWLGIHQEWSLRMPAPLAAAVTGLLCVFMTWWLLQRRPEDASPDEPEPMTVALVAGLIWISAYPTSKLLYLARPDPILTAFLAAAWALGTLLLYRQDGRRWPLALGFWLCVAGALLTKGPIGLLPVLYLLLGSRLLVGRWSAFMQTGWWWGLPLSLGLLGYWATTVYRIDPDHFQKSLVGGEVLSRFSDGGEGKPSGPLQIVLTLWELPLKFLTVFAPWSLVILFALVGQTPRRWFSHRLGPAYLWFAIVFAAFLPIAYRRADYLMPLYPAAAAMAAWWLIGSTTKYRVGAKSVAALAVVVSLGVAVHWHTTSHAAKTGLGKRVGQFAVEVRHHASDEAIVFDGAGYNGLQSLLGYHQPYRPTAADRLAATWIIRPIENDADAQTAKVVSGDLPDRGSEHLRLGLFRLSQERPNDR
jgi:4-amino-4-deoxy-L-arabinose transferase-like glycosyltransferase